MYFEQIFPKDGPALDQGIELSAQWAQWAQTGITSGAVENEGDIRYNLNQFWVQKAAIYEGEPQAGKDQLNKLDAYAHGLWNALESGMIYASTPSLLGELKAMVTGGTPDRPGATAAAGNAATAAKDAAQLSIAAGGASAHQMANFYTQQAANAAKDLADANKIWEVPGPFGLSWTTWAMVGGVGVLLLLWKLK